MGWKREEVVMQECLENEMEGIHKWIYVIAVDYRSLGERIHYFVCANCGVCGQSDNDDAFGEKELYRQKFKFDFHLGEY